MPPSFAAAETSFTHSDPFALHVAKDGDLDMPCKALIDEAALMRDIIQTTEDIKGDSEFNGHAVTAVGAVGSFLVGTATAGLGLAAAGFVAAREVEGSGDNADNIQDTAHQRRALISGIFKAKNCTDPEGAFAAAMTPVREKSAINVGKERLATLTHPAERDSNKPRYND